MNGWALAALGGATLLWFSSAKPNLTLVRGKAYRAVFEMPAALAGKPDLSKLLQQAMPPGSDITVDGSKVQIRFIAPVSEPIGDVVTPLGTMKLLKLEELG